MQSNYYCYFIVTANRTYIGITNLLSKRIKQHNNQIKGGAKSTSMYTNWKYHTIIGNFKSKSEAASFEWYWKHVKNNNKWIGTKSGINNKMNRLIELLLEEKWDHLQIVDKFEFE